MRKFKHKKTGQIVTSNKEGLFLSENGGYTLQRWIFEDSNDWEEVKDIKEEVCTEIVKTDWLITSFKSENGKLREITPNGKFKINEDNALSYTLNNMLKGEDSVEDGAHIIFSVKNNKGIEFTIGEKVSVDGKELTISKFDIYRDKYMYVLFNETDEHENINDIEKIATSKTFLFTTEDGKDIYDGDDIHLFSVCNYGTWEEKRMRPSLAMSYKRWKQFHTKEAREEYIKMNKPMYSMKQLFDNSVAFSMIPENKDIRILDFRDLKK